MTALADAALSLLRLAAAERLLPEDPAAVDHEVAAALAALGALADGGAEPISTALLRSDLRAHGDDASWWRHSLRDALLDLGEALRAEGAAGQVPPSRPCIAPPASATALAEEHATASARTAVAPSAGDAEEADPASQTEPCAPPDGSEVWVLDADLLPEPPSEPLPLVVRRSEGTVFAPALVGEGGL